MTSRYRNMYRYRYYIKIAVFGVYLFISFFTMTPSIVILTSYHQYSCTNISFLYFCDQPDDDDDDDDGDSH